ncbi:MAG: alginate lyase family protein [Micavibrio sp.]|nr:alginate lyase family protein [Micavibrio sp.]
MARFQKVYDDILTGSLPGLGSRLEALAAGHLGTFRRLPARELSETDFLDTLQPGAFENYSDFLEHSGTTALPWKDVPQALIPARTIENAEETLQRHFPLLDSDFTFPGPIDWHCGFGDGRKHWSDSPNTAAGDLRPCRELNRHRSFVTLALAALKTGDTKYARAFSALLNSWCDQNAPEKGVNYIYSIDLGIRGVAWVFASRLLRGQDGFDRATQSRLQRNLYAQARHIAEYLAYAEETGRNHRLIGEAASLAYLALTCPQWKESEKWLKQALGALWATFDDQVYTDGMHFEASFGYHLLVTEFMLLLFSEMRRQKRPIPAKAYTLLEKMATALRLARQPDGELPNINDNDGSVLIPLELTTEERLQGIMAAMAALYERPDFKSATASDWPLYAHLLLGEKGAEDFRLLAHYAEDFPALAEFHEARIHIVRQQKDYVLFKNNPDPSPESGHNHADLLSLLLFFDGTQVLTDAGTYRYADDNGFRNALRSTAAHNTVTVDTHGQSEPQGRFMWATQLKPGLTEVVEEADTIVIDGQHDSFERMGVTHRRIAVWLKKQETLVVIDQMQGQDTHYFEQFWHFPPGSMIEDAGIKLYRLTQGGKPSAFIRFLREKDNDAHELTAGTERNKTCNISPRYGYVLPSTAVKHSWTSTLAKGNSAHRITIFSKTDIDPAFAEVWHAEFRLFGWSIDCNQTPAKVTVAKD